MQNSTRLELRCFEDMIIDGELCCKKDRRYIAVEAPDPDQKEYFTIMGCEENKNVECTSLDIGLYFEVQNIENYI